MTARCNGIHSDDKHDQTLEEESELNLAEGIWTVYCEGGCDVTKLCSIKGFTVQCSVQRLVKRWE